MSYIFAHGTVNGYKVCHPENVPQGVDASKLDIRYGVDQSNDRLSRSAGYAFQMFEKGVLISIIKLFEDGDRSGGGKGFFSFSVFLPNNERISGKILKSILDGLMRSYCNQLPICNATCNKTIDWSFVDEAEQSIKSVVKTVQKPIVTTVASNNDYAYINVFEADFEKYLNAPFQGCYGRYRLVFLGDALISNDQKESYSLLKIDFSNIDYRIVWHGDSSKYKHLPSKVNSSEIESGCYEFEKSNYIGQKVWYKNGEIDADSSTLTLTIPELTPITSKIYVDVLPTECADFIYLIAGETAKTLIHEDSSLYVDFIGDEIDLSWKPVLRSECSNYQLKSSSSIKPRNFVGSGIQFHVVKMKTVRLRIYDEENNAITGYWQTIGFSVKTNTMTLSPLYKDEALEYQIEETQDFANLTFKIAEQYQINTKPGKLGNDLYQLNVKKVDQQGGDDDQSVVEKETPFKNLRVSFEQLDKKMIAILTGVVVVIGMGLFGFIYWQEKVKEQERSIEIAEQYLEKDEMFKDSLYCYQKTLEKSSVLYKQYTQYINSRYLIDNGTKKQINTSALSSEDKTFIDTLLANEKKLEYLRSYYKGTIQKTSWNKIRNQMEKYVEPVSTSYAEELSAFLTEQQSVWNYDAINERLKPISDDEIDDWKKKQPNLYAIYMKLDWLRKTRDLINTLNIKEYNKLTPYLKDDGDVLYEKYKDYADDNIKKFLTEQMRGDDRKKKLIDEGKKRDNFKNLTFAEVRELVKSVKTQAQIDQEQAHGRVFTPEPTAPTVEQNDKKKDQGKNSQKKVRTDNRDY